MTRIFFATDIHGSEVCWNKFINAGKFYNAEVLILGGDMTGKAIIPLVQQGNGIFHTTFGDQEYILRDEEELRAMLKRIRNRGFYPYITTSEEITTLSETPDKVHDIFLSEALKTLEAWLFTADAKLAGSGIRCYVCPGNDDMPEIDALIRSARHVHLAEGDVIQLDEHHEMISSGWTNPTPWHTYREESEEQLQARYECMLSQIKDPRNAIFNIHVPPYASMLDDAPELTADLRPKYAGNATHPVGSRSLRNAIDKYQPLLSLHGHIHESRGAVHIGRTLAINPGSMYEQGNLLGAVVQLERHKLKNYILTTG